MRTAAKLEAGRVLAVAGAALLFGGCFADNDAASTLLWSAQERRFENESVRIERISLDRQGFVQVLVWQDNLDVRVTLRRDRAVLAVSDCPTRRDAVEAVSSASLPAGHYQLVVELLDGQSAHGTYALEVFHSPARTHRATKQWRAVDALARACMAIDEDADEATKQRLVTAARAARAANDARLEGAAWFAAASVDYWKLYDYASAVAHSRRAIAAFDGASDPRHQASSRAMLGFALVDLANQRTGGESLRLYREGARALDHAIARQEALGRRYDLAHSCNKVGYARYYQGEIALSNQAYERALAIFRELGETASAAVTLQNYALNLHSRGDFVEAARAYDALLTELNEADEPDLYATVVQNSALPYAALGEIDTALRKQQKAHELYEQLRDRNGSARSLQAIGSILLNVVGDPGRALGFYEAALPLRTEASGIDAANLGIGDALYRLGRPEEALPHHRRVAKSSASVLYRARGQIALARDLQARGTGVASTQAAAILEPLALAGDSAIPDPLRASALAELGAIRAVQDTERGIRLLQEALTIHRRTRSRVNVIDTQHRIARLQMQRGRRDLAESTLEEALHEAETLRVAATDPELRMALVAARRGLQEMQVDILMRRARTPERVLQALAASEHMRARTLLDSLQLGAGRSSDTELDARLAGKAHQYERVLLQGERGKAAMAALARDIVSLELQIHVREAGAVGSSDTSSVTPQALERFIAQLPDDTLLLVYQLSDWHVWRWTIGRSGVSAEELVVGAETGIEHDVDQLLAASSGSMAASVEDWTRLASNLSATLRLDELRDVSAKRLIVIADGALARAPFAALTSTPDARKYTPLIERFEVSFAPSLAALMLPANVPAGEWRRDVLAYADPAVQPPVAIKTGSRRTAPSEWLTDAVVRSPLPGARREVRAIESLVPTDRRLVRTGFDATRQRFLTDNPGDFRILHLATHAAVDWRHPRLTFFQLALYDEHGQELPGLVRLQEVRNLPLRNELVVLSACRTAVGRDWRGEGPIGLGRAFLEAGARSVIATLWEAPDAASADLFQRFYQGLLREELTPAAALRTAQMSLANNPRWGHPRFWASQQLFIRALPGSAGAI